MRTKITQTLIMPIQVELEVEYCKRSKEASIIGVSIADSNRPTPRAAYAAMQSSQYKEMDTIAHTTLLAECQARMSAYQNSHPNEYPKEEIRSIPLPFPDWSKLMMAISGAHLRIPGQEIHTMTTGFQVFFEHVLSKIPTVYLWDAVPGSGEIQKLKDKIGNGSAFRCSEPEIMEEGSLRLQWPRFA